MSPVLTDADVAAAHAASGVQRMEPPAMRLDQLKQERLMAAAGALVKIQQTCAEAIAKIHQLDGAISILEQLHQSEQPKD